MSKKVKTFAILGDYQPAESGDRIIRDSVENKNKMKEIEIAGFAASGRYGVGTSRCRLEPKNPRLKILRILGDS